MTKITEKQHGEAGRSPATPPQEQMQAAYQVHTLAQMLYGQMAGSQPCMTHPAMQAGFRSAPSPGAPGWMTVWSVAPWAPSQARVMTPFMPPEFGPFPR
jgi:hypothetical protein